MPHDDPPANAPSSTPGEPPLRPADREELLHSLAFALRYQGRKRVDTAGDVMARITAERLLEHLQASRFVVMKRPPPALGPDQAYAPSVAKVVRGE